MGDLLPRPERRRIQHLILKVGAELQEREHAYVRMR
jgi:hypothetical protein